MRNILHLMAFSVIFSTFCISLKAQASETDGEWLFSKADFLIYKFGESTLLETITINRAEDLGNEGFPFDRVFVKASVTGNHVSVTLNDGNTYLLNDNYLILEKDLDSENPQTISLPSTKYKVVNGNLQFELEYSYGDTKYNFPLKGKMIIIMTKETNS